MRPRRHLLRLAAAAAMLLLAVVAGAAQPAPYITPQRYVDMTIARLTASLAAWSAGRRPTQDDDRAALARFNVPLADYLAYGGSHRAEIERYLAARPDRKQTLDGLNEQIRQQIERVE